MKKTILALTLTLLMSVTSALAAPSQVFADVKPGDWYYNGVQYAYENSLMNGTGNGMFSPSQSTTRGMIVTIIHRMEGEPVAAPSSFQDVPVGQWYAKAVGWASANQIVNGYSDTKFGPNDDITRQQMAAILFRYAGTCGYDTTGRADLTGYADVGKVQSYAEDAMAWAVDAGLINGTSEETLSPDGKATRAQVAIILMRFCEKYGAVEDKPEVDPPVVEPDPPVVEPDPPVVEPDPPVVEPDPPVVEPDPPVVEPDPPVVEPDPPVVEPDPPVVEPDTTVTYEQYMDMTEEEQEAFMDTFATTKDFYEWLNDAREKYEAEQDRIEIGGDGNIDIGDIIGGKT